MSEKSVNEQLLDHAVNHSIDLQRYSNGVVQKMMALLNRADAEIESALYSALSRLPAGSFTVQRLNAVLKGFRDINGKAYENVDSSINSELVDLAEFESEYQADLFEHVIPFKMSITKIDPEVVYAAAMARPFQITKDRAVNLSDYVSGLSDDRAAKVRDAIKLGYVSGLTTDQIIRNIRGTKSAGYADGLMEGSRHHVGGMTRTALSHMSSFTRQRFYEANAELAKGYKWVSTLDSSTSPICQARDGKIYPLTSNIYPPAHINACLKGTKITTINGLVNIEDVKVGDLVLTHQGRWRKVTTVMARKHNGSAVTLIDNFGRSVRLTNEHPIITRNKGWIEAGQIKVGDVFFNNIKQFEWLNNITASSSVPHAVLINAHHIKTDLTQELISYGIFSCASGMSSAVKLNDGVADNEVRIESENSVLAGIDSSDRVENRRKQLFVWRWISFKNCCKGISRFFDCFLRKRGVVNKHSSGTCGGAFGTKFGVCFVPVLISGFIMDVLGIIFARFGPVFGFYSKCSTSLPDGVVGQSIFSFNTPQAFAFLPVFNSDKINDFFVGHSYWFNSTCTKIAEYHYSDYVYNLSVDDDETYVADGFLVHNCRSTTIMITKSWRDLGIDMDEFVSTRASMNGQVPQDITYQDWLKGQSIDRQDDILGITKGKLFRDGGLTVQNFVDMQGRTLTIAQLKERNKEIFEKLGL